MVHPPPPTAVTLTALGGQALAQLSDIVRQANEQGVTKMDLQRLEDLLRAIAEKPEDDPDRLEDAANVGQLVSTAQGLVPTLIGMVDFLKTQLP